MAILKLAAAAACLTLVACQREPTLIELSQRDIVVHGILIGGEDSVRVFIGRPSPSNTYDMPVPVVDAQVRLIAGDQTINLSRSGQCLAHEAIGPEPGGPNDGCYSAQVPGGVVNGETYVIEITVPGVPTIRGSTRVPNIPSVSSPSANAELPIVVMPDSGGGSFQVSWSGVATNDLVVVHIETDLSNCGVGFREGERVTVFITRSWVPAAGSDTLELEAVFFNCGPAPAERTSAHVGVTVYDDNYAVYVQSFDESIPFAEASAGLSGAFGLFGSAARSAVPVVLVRQ